MQHSTTRDFLLIDFHDSPVDSVDVSAESIRLTLGFANLLATHPSNPHGVAKCVEPCELVFTGVHRSTLRVYNEESRSWSLLDAPGSPEWAEILETAYEAGQGSGHRYVLRGFLKLGWSEWAILADGFEFRWGGISSDAWFVDWPPAGG